VVSMCLLYVHVCDDFSCNCAGVLKAETGGVAVAESTALKGQQLQQTDVGRLIDCVKAEMRGGMPAEAGMSLPIGTAAIGQKPKRGRQGWRA